MTTQERHLNQMYRALKTITAYQSPEKLQRSSETEWGLRYSEALEYAYENVIAEAKAGLKGIRRPKEKKA